MRFLVLKHSLQIGSLVVLSVICQIINFTYGADFLPMGYILSVLPGIATIQASDGTSILFMIFNAVALNIIAGGTITSIFPD